jgi:hypothetical protein
MRYVRSKGHAETIEAFRRSCELVLAAVGVHGKGEVHVGRYEYLRSDFAGVWVTYTMLVTEGERLIAYQDYEDNWKQSNKFDKAEEPVIGLGLAQEFMTEVGASLAPYHEGQPARWTAFGFGVSGKGVPKPIGEKALSATHSVESATGQGIARIEDWLNGIVYSTSDIGAVQKLWLAARAF